MTALKKYFLFILLFVFFIIQISGCAVYMAAKQPGKKDIDLFRTGTSRSTLLAEFGMPAVSETRNGKKFEIYRFIQGYSTGVKAGRAVFHGAADFFTLGLWEIVGTPAETVFSGEELAYEVSYDVNDRVDEVIVLKKE